MDYGRLAELVAQEVFRLVEPRLKELSDAGPAPEYLTLQQAARLTSFSYDFVYDAVRRGELPAVKKGRDWRVGLVDLRAWMERDRGGDLPPRSRLKELIGTHMPGLS